MDSFEITKIVGAVCGSLLVLLLVETGANSIVNPAGHGGGHENAYVIEVEGAESEAAVEEVAAVPFEEVYASADAAAGEGLFRACQSCHKLEAGANATGPYLYGVVGRNIGAADGYTYSSAMAEHGDVWTPENLSHFLENPKSYVPGTKMAYNGMRDIEDRANLIAYLDSLDN